MPSALTLQDDLDEDATSLAVCFTDAEKDYLVSNTAGDTLFDAFKSISSFCRVQTNIPTNMQGRIEGYANRLAQDISNGRTSLDSLDLNRIGEEVLAGCAPSDMEAFAGNISEILPTLSTLQKEVRRAGVRLPSH